MCCQGCSLEEESASDRAVLTALSHCFDLGLDLGACAPLVEDVVEEGAPVCRLGLLVR